MSKRNLFIGIGVIALAIAWYAFRPELLFINKTVNEGLPTTEPTTMAMSKATEPMSWQKGTFVGSHMRLTEQRPFISSRTGSAYSASPTSKLLMGPTCMFTWSPPKSPRTTRP